MKPSPDPAPGPGDPPALPLLGGPERPAPGPDRPFVHYCAFCGWRREAVSLTVLTPHCPKCGCRLSSCTPGDYERSGLAVEGAPYQAEPKRDASASFVAVAAW